MTSYTPYSSRKIWRIHELYFTQHLQREDLCATSRRNLYAVLDYKSWNILEYNNHGAHAMEPQYILKKCRGEVHAQAQPVVLPHCDDEGLIIVPPLAILARKMVMLGVNNQTNQVAT
nr:hypothetical protein [Tanacetum cinerariifolium]